MEQGQSSTLLQPPPPTATTIGSTRPEKLPVIKMGSEQLASGESKSALLQATDAKIDELQANFLPPIPHLLSVPTKDPYRGQCLWETNRGTPFETWEFDQLQYMTLIPGDVRGVARPRGGWEDEINARSPYNMSRSRSGTITPQGERDPNKPRAKISLADYKNGKRAPKKPAEPQLAMLAGKSKEEAQITVKVEPKVAQNGLAHPTGPATAKPTEPVRAADARKPSMPSASEQKPVAAPPRNNLDRPLPPKPKEAQRPVARPDNPRPETAQLPAAKLSEPKPEPKPESKRPLEKADQSQPEKRMKVEARQSPSVSSIGQRLPSDSMSKIFGTGARPKSSTPKPSLPSNKSSSVDANTKKPADVKKENVKPAPESVNQAREKPPAGVVPEMPRLLSPLPEYFTSPNPSAFGSSQTADKPAKNDRVSPVKSPLKKVVDAATPVAKGKEQTETMTLPALPDLLPRELPPNVEELLAKNRHPGKKLDTVQARRERSRNPDTPGVARKAPRLGQEEKRRVSKEPLEEPARELIVKLKYKKHKAKIIERILKTKPVPNREMDELANARVESKSSASKPKAVDKKRPRPTDDQPEPSAKRSKLPSKSDPEKRAAHTTPLAPAFKSPAPASSSSQKMADTQKHTPRKGDAMKSVAMQKVDSNDSNPPTPKTRTLSTPGSVDKSRMNGGDPKAAELDGYKRAHAKYTSLGTALKRKRDGYIQTGDHQMASIAGAECLLAYVVAFDAFDKQYRLTGKANTGDNWVTLFPLLQKDHELAKAYPVLDIIVLLLGGVASAALLAVHNQRFAEAPPSTAPDYLKFRDHMSANIRRGTDFWDAFHARCQDLWAARPGAMRDGAALAFLRAPGGQARPIDVVKGAAAAMLREYVKVQGVEWEMQIDF